MFLRHHIQEIHPFKTVRYLAHPVMQAYVILHTSEFWNNDEFDIKNNVNNIYKLIMQYNVLHS